MVARLVVVSGPSGVGKTSVCAELERRADCERVITATTRAPRGEEKPGIDYHFFSREEFERLRDEGGLLEWAPVFDHLYGTPRKQAEEILARGRNAILNIDVQGAATIRASGLLHLLVFLAPPNWETLKTRLTGRGTDDEATIARRLEVARAEMARSDEFDLVVVNHEIVQAAAEIAANLQA